MELIISFQINILCYSALIDRSESNCFSNHSCDPNTFFQTNLEEEKDWRTLREIKKGQQLTSNYLNFYYLGEKQEEFQCNCGALHCHKFIKGFKHVSLDEKLKLIPTFCPQMRKIWLNNHQRIVLIEDLHIPDSLQLNFLNQNNFSLVCHKKFKKGNLIFNYMPLKVKQDSIMIIKHGKEYKKLNMSDLNGDKKHNYKFQYLKDFTKHSVKANVEIVGDESSKPAVCIEDLNIRDKLMI